METNFEEQLATITEFIKSEANTHTVIGDQFQLGEFTCIPVIRVGLGFGTGGGKGNSPKTGKGEGGGSGAGMGIEPIGFLVTKGDQISFVNAEKRSGFVSAFEKIPGLLEEFIKKNEKTSEV